MMRTSFFLTPILVLAMTVGSLAQPRPGCPSGNCPNGQCPIQGNIFGDRGPIFHGGQSVGIKAREPARREPAVQVRIIAPTAHFTSVVRIQAELATPLSAHGKKMTAKCGSGFVVIWNGRYLVPTAGHVVRDCNEVWVWHPGRHCWCRCIDVRFDPGWDLAFCELTAVDAAGLPTAELAWGADATPPIGTMVESCGWGPGSVSLDFAVNTGAVMEYTGPPGATTTDWLKLSGPAREGDSGGPVFNAHGQVVGILWGTDDHFVIATQAGKIHELLRQTYGEYRNEGMAQRTQYVAEDVRPIQMQVLPLQRGPSAATPAPTSEPPMKEPKMPFRKGIVDEDRHLEAELGAIRGQLESLANRPAPPAPAPIIVNPPPAAPAPEKSPGNAIEQKLDDFLHKLPIQGPITKLEEKQLESKNGLTRIIGALAAIDGIMVVIIFGTVGIILVGHAIYKKCHADKAAIDAKLSAIPGVGKALASGFDRLDAFNTTKVEPIFANGQADIAAAKATADAALHIGTAAALATTPIAPVVAAVNPTIAK